MPRPRLHGCFNRRPMSYILDALRKSDEARRRGTSPILDRVRAPHEAPRRRWPWMVAGAVLVAANLAVITWVLRPGLGLSLPGVLSRTAPGTPVADLGRSRDPSPPPLRVPAPSAPAITAPPVLGAPAITAPPTPNAIAPATGPTATAPARTPPVPPEPARTTVPNSPPVEPAPVLAKRGEAVKPVPPAPVAPRAEERRQPLPLPRLQHCSALPHPPAHPPRRPRHPPMFLFLPPLSAAREPPSRWRHRNRRPRPHRRATISCRSSSSRSTSMPRTPLTASSSSMGPSTFKATASMARRSWRKSRRTERW